jgi:SNF2 family DNA or RNA helicase
VALRPGELRRGRGAERALVPVDLRRLGVQVPGHAVWFADEGAAAPDVLEPIPLGLEPPGAREPVSLDGLRAPRILGRHVTRLLPGDELDASPATSGKNGKGRYRKAYRKHRVPGGFVHQQLSPFDLLWPMLEPPIALDDARVGVEDRPERLPARLFDYQIEGVRFLCANHHALLADEMGTGKTVMSCVALRLLVRSGAVRSALIVCPLSLLGVWDEHLARWAPELRVTVVHGDGRARYRDWRAAAHVHVTTFDTLRGDVLAERSGTPTMDVGRRAAFDLVLLDEAHSVKNVDSGRTRAVRRLSPTWRWALTGTPVENRIDDLVGLFGFVKPGLLTHGVDWQPATVRDRVAPYVLRRTKKDVIAELPPKLRQDLWLEPDEEQRQVLQRLEEDGTAELDKLGESAQRIHVFKVLAELKRVCNFAPGRCDGPKLRAVREKVTAIRDAGGKVLVFTQWVQRGLDEICRGLEDLGVVRFDGSMSAAARQDAVRRFQNDPDATAFVATVQSAGVGLTLTEASYVIHFDHWWNPACMWQAEDRAHRRGQTVPVTVYSLWMAGTIEERIHDILAAKGLLHEQVTERLSEDKIASMIPLDEWKALLRRG